MINAPLKNPDGTTKIYTINARYWTTYKGVETRLPDKSVSFHFVGIEFVQGGGTVVWRDNYNGVGKTLNDIPFSQNEGQYAYYTNKLWDRAYDQTKTGLLYSLAIRNSNNGSSLTDPDGGKTTKVWEIEDILLTKGEQKRTYYQSYTFANISDNTTLPEPRKSEVKQKVIDAINSPNKVYGIKSDGTKELIKENFKYKETIEINDKEAKYIKLKFEFSKGIELNNNKLDIVIQAQPTEGELKKFDDGTYGAARQTYSSGSIVYLRESLLNQDVDVKPATLIQNKGTYDYYSYTSIGNVDPRSNINNSPNQTIAYQTGGSFLEYFTEVFLRNEDGAWGPIANEEIPNAQVIQLLPPAFEFVSVIGQYWNSQTIAAPEIIDNYKNTGRQAVIYTIPKFIPAQDGYKQLHIKTKIKATAYAERGNNLIESFFVYPNNDLIKNPDKAYKDKMDLDNDENRNENFITASSFINFIPPLELIIKKSVGIEKTELGQFATGDLGGNFYYKINVFNNTIGSAKNVSVIETLPYLGDHSITPNDKGQYIPRNSQFSTPLVEALEDIPENSSALAKFNVFYQLTDQGANIESVRDGEWLSKDQISDFSKVKSIKFELKPGQELESKKEVSFLFKNKIPKDTSLTPGSVGVNSSALSTDKKLYTEGNNVKITFETYKVEGTYFKDWNKNGKIDFKEDGVSDKIVELIDANTGEVVTDPITGEKMTTKTDLKGKYNFKVYKRGDYKVRFTKTDSQAFTSIFGNTITNNHIQEKPEGTNYGLTNSISLNPMQKSAILNGGLIAETKDIEIQKKSTETDSEGENIPLANAEFTLMQGESVIGKVTTDNEGKAKFTDIPFGEYKLIETKAPTGYEILEPDGKDLTLAADVLEVQTFNNKPILRDLTLTKLDKDNNSKLEGVLFGIFRKTNGVFESEPYSTALTNKDGIAKFEEVPYGTYMLQEISTITGYAPLTGDINEIEVKENGTEPLNLGNVLNEKIKGIVKVTKVDKEDPSKKLEGVTFALMLGDVEIATSKTNIDGIATFNGVPYGDYKVIEKKGLLNYLPLSTALDVQIRENGATIDLGNVENQLIKGTIRVLKTDEKGQPLEGVEFTLMNGNKVVSIIKTKKNGNAMFKDIAYGDYQLKESKEIEGYIKDNKIYQFKIRNNGEVLEQKVINKTVPKVNVPATGDRNNLIESLLLFGISSLLLILFTNAKRKYD